MKHLNIKIFGFVQGVFFRFSAQEKAKILGINGFVRNESDGTVYIEAEGEEDDLRQFLNWCHKGPSGARVEKVESEFSSKIKNFADFNTY